MAKMKYLNTYALCEITNDNPKFVKYLADDVSICELTLIEFYGLILKKYDEKTAQFWFKKLFQYTRPADIMILLKAMHFKVENAKNNISFFDSVGYIFAIENKGVFVTGDKEFEKMPGVEFVKA